MRSLKSVAVPAGRCRSNDVSGGVTMRSRLGLSAMQLIDRRADQVGDQAEIDGVVDGDGVGENGRIERDIFKAVLLGIVGDDDGGENFRHIVRGLPGSSLRL